MPFGEKMEEAGKEKKGNVEEYEEKLQVRGTVHLVPEVGKRRVRHTF
jgi:hypothetical protein